MLFILDILVFVSLQNVFLISASHNPPGVIAWSWEMVNTSWKIPIVVLPYFLFLCDGISHSYQFPLEKVGFVLGNI